MSAFSNSGFQDAGAGAGEADAWTWLTATSWRFARYGDSRFERFEIAWGNEPFVDVLSGALFAFFNVTTPIPFDGFEREWMNDSFTPTLDAAASAEFSAAERPPSGMTFEDLEVGWFGNERFVFNFTPELLLVGVFDSLMFEAFEAHWLTNEAYVFTFTDMMLSPATFVEGTPGTVETFEAMKLDIPLNVTLPSTINATAHGYVNGDVVRLFTAVDGTGGDLPTGLNDRTDYHVVGATANTFEVALAAGGTPVVMTDPGHGASYIRVDMSKSWGGNDGDTAGSDP